MYAYSFQGFRRFPFNSDLLNGNASLDRKRAYFLYAAYLLYNKYIYVLIIFKYYIRTIAVVLKCPYHFFEKRIGNFRARPSTRIDGAYLLCA
ncbi:hypothetical protein HNQ91_001818 [Filimonas zeae]|nr:hypothetical protein [Filimonas zeae]